MNGLSSRNEPVLTVIQALEGGVGAAKWDWIVCCSNSAPAERTNQGKTGDAEEIHG